jgi:hypothetical protein
VDAAGDTILVPATLTRPMPWSMLTELAPVTFHNRVEVPPELIADGLLLNSWITEGCPAGEPLPEFGSNIITEGVPNGGAGFVDWTGNEKQPGMRRSSSSDTEIITDLFNVDTSKNILPVNQSLIAIRGILSLEVWISNIITRQEVK